MSPKSQKQLEQLYSAMTAQERAAHIVQAWKENREEEPLVRLKTPPEQSKQLNELLAAARCVNREMATIALLNEQIAERLQLRLAWLQSLRAWALNAQSLMHALFSAAPEPLTESEAEARRQELRAEQFTLEEAAQFLADAEATPEDDEESLVARHEKEIRSAIASGKLRASGKGQNRRITYGDLCDWRGEGVSVIPEWGFEVEVLPDNQADVVERRRKNLEWARRAIERSPTMLAEIEPAELRLPDDAGMTNRMALALSDGLRQEVPAHWKDVLAVEQCIEEVRERLGGEDPADEVVRSAINKAKALLEDTAVTLADHGIPVELNDPNENDVVPFRELLEKVIEAETSW